MSEGALRLFLAAEVPAAVRDVLADWGARCAAGDPALRPLPADALHVTLHFLGSRPGGDVPVLSDLLARAAAQAGDAGLGLDGSLWLAPRRPHVLTCALRDEDGALARAHAVLAAGLAAELGVTPETRPLRPHVTVARVRRGSAPRPGAEPPAPGARFTCPALVLQRSHLGPGGSRYEELARAALFPPA